MQLDTTYCQHFTSKIKFVAILIGEWGHWGIHHLLESFYLVCEFWFWLQNFVPERFLFFIYMQNIVFMVWVLLPCFLMQTNKNVSFIIYNKFFIIWYSNNKSTYLYNLTIYQIGKFVDMIQVLIQWFLNILKICNDLGKLESVLDWFGVFTILK